MDEPEYSRRYWEQQVPYAHVTRPRGIHGLLVRVFWRTYTPFHATVRDVALRLRIIHHEGRQNFLIGRIADGHQFRDIIDHCVSLGYGAVFVALVDDDEVLGLRLVESFKRQYHIRFFRDGEVRGHYEYTPEAHPWKHWKGVDFEDRREVFYEHLGERIIPI